MSNTKWRDEYFHACGRHGIPVRIATKILRHANTVQRAAEVDCSVSNIDARAHWLQRGNAARDAITSLRVGSAPSFGVTFHGDPRGACVRLRIESAPDGIPVPSTGFTAAQIDQLSRIGEAVRS